MRITLIISCLLLLILLTACSFKMKEAKDYSEDEIMKKDWRLNAEEYSSSTASIMIGAGELRVSSTSESLISADFSYTSADFEQIGRASCRERVFRTV